MNAEETSALVQSENAKDKLDTLIQLKINVAANYLAIAKLLYEFHRDSLYKFLDCDSFNEFLGIPELGFKKSKAYDLIAIWELFKTRMNVDDRTLLDIDRTKLKKLLPIASAVEGNPEEWLEKARALSVSDLAIEIAGVSGKEVSISPPSSMSPVSGRGTPAPLASLDERCCICGATPAERSHFPITKGAGAKESHWVPMCRGCHDEFHRGAETFILNYKRKWADYYYERIGRD